MAKDNPTSKHEGNALPRSSQRRQGSGGAPASGGGSTNPPSTAKFRRDYGAQVPYGSSELARAVADRRTVTMVGRPPNQKPMVDPSYKRNLAGARLSDGTTIITDQSGGKGANGVCAESNMAQQIDTLNQQRVGNGQEPLSVIEMYSERQPCCRCESMFNDSDRPPPMAPDAKIEWTSEYYDAPTADRQTWTDSDRDWIKSNNDNGLDELNKARKRYLGI